MNTLFTDADGVLLDLHPTRRLRSESVAPPPPPHTAAISSKAAAAEEGYASGVSSVAAARRSSAVVAPSPQGKARTDGGGKTSQAGNSRRPETRSTVPSQKAPTGDDPMGELPVGPVVETYCYTLELPSNLRRSRNCYVQKHLLEEKPSRW